VCHSPAIPFTLCEDRAMKALMTLGLMFGFVALSTGDDKAPAAKFDATKIVGKWKVSEGKKLGTAVGDDGKKGLYIFTKDTISIQDEGKELFGMKYTVDTKATPVAIDMEMTASIIEGMKGEKALGIIEIDGDTFKLCYTDKGKPRPTKFDDDKGNSFVMKREKEEKK
jgi:uncharacterized protein (TIGR03067 family)